MKNIVKRLSKVFLALLIIPVITLSFTACKKKKEPVIDDNPPPVVNEEVYDDNPNSPITSGIYKFEKEISLSKDKFYIDLDKVLSHFKTNDLNGVDKKIVEDLNFVEFSQNVIQSNNLPKYIEFNSKNEVTTYLYDDGTYTSINKFLYYYNNDTTTFKVEGKASPAISYDAENDIVYIIFPFTYELDGELVYSPLYFKTKLVYVCDSFETLTSEKSTSEFSYKADSMKIYESSNNIDSKEINEKLAKIFNIEESENVQDDVETILSNYKTVINNNFTLVITYKELDGTLSFSLGTITNNKFIVSGVTVNLIVDNFSDKTTELYATIDIDEGVVLHFTLEKAANEPVVDIPTENE